jgi:hypothetical protein
MRKLIKSLMAGMMLFGIGVGFAGCADETGTKEETKITTPSATTTDRREVKVDKSGQAPPAAPSEKRP